MPRRTPVALLLTAFAVLAAACGSGSGSDEQTAGQGSDETSSAVTVPQIEPTASEPVPSALEDPRNDAFPEPLLDPDELVSGGPPPDGIPSIDDPRFLQPEDVDFLEDDEPVLALRVGDDARTYPIQVLIWHEIVNDTVDGEVDGTAVAVRLDAVPERGVEVAGRDLVVWVEAGTRSALDSGAISEGRDVGASGVFDAVVDGRMLSFEPADEGFTDEETGSTWNVLGHAVDGPLEGTRLEAVAHVDTFWFAWGAFQPDTRIER